jgi:hypothetical protein
MEGTVVSVEADVRWVRRARGVDRHGLNALGIQFCDLPPAVRDSVTRYVALMGDPTGA